MRTYSHVQFYESPERLAEKGDDVNEVIVEDVEPIVEDGVIVDALRESQTSEYLLMLELEKGMYIRG